jgi:hypothetical protein
MSKLKLNPRARTIADQATNLAVDQLERLIKTLTTSLVTDLGIRPTGSGTVNQIPKWVSGTALGNSSISDNGTTVQMTEVVDLGAHKITSLANGSAPQDAAAFGQIGIAVNAAVSGTANTLAMFTGTNTIGNSAITYNGTNSFRVNKSLSVNTTNDPDGTFSVASPDAGTAFAAGSWATGGWSVFGPNSTATGGALGLGYSTTSDEGQITVVSPSVAWKKLHAMALSYQLDVNGGANNGINIDSSGNLTATHNLTVNGKALIQDSVVGETQLTVKDAHTAQTTSIIEALIDSSTATLLGSGSGGSGGPPSQGGGGIPANPTATGLIVDTSPTWTGSGNNIALLANAQHGTISNYALWCAHGDVNFNDAFVHITSGGGLQSDGYITSVGPFTASTTAHVVGATTLDSSLTMASGQVATLGEVIIRGANTNTAPTNLAALDLFTGRAAGGSLVNANQTVADVAFDYGGASGGYRHWISTEHDTTAATNKMRFWLNSSATAGGSALPGTGNAEVLQLRGDGSAKLFGATEIVGAATLDSTLSVVGNTTLGSLTNSNSHQINGRTIQTVGGFADSVASTLTSTAGAFSVNGASFTSSGTLDATATTRTNAGIQGVATATRSAGANSVWNIGGLFTATGGQINQALRTTDGDVVLNATSGLTEVVGSFFADGNVTLNNISGATTIGGALTASSTVHIVGALTADSTGSFAGAVTITANPGSGAELLVTNSTTGQTTSNYCINATELGSYNCTSAALQAFGVNAQVNATRSAGANSLTCTAAFFDAQNGQVNKALVADHGDVILNNSNGTTTIKGNVGFQGTAPIAKPTVTGSRGGNAALASLLTSLANYGLITDSTTA